jgi:hypothetical protein
VILRPLFKSPEDGAWKDSENWELDEATSSLPGTLRVLSQASHSHLCLEDTLMSIPEMKVGNTIWWHADVSFLPVTIFWGVRENF